MNIKRIFPQLLWFLLALAGVLAVALLGPRANVDQEVSAITLPNDLDGYLREAEAAYGDVRPGAEKSIVWAGQAGEKTALSIVSLHGFSANRQETAPLAEQLASQLGANLYRARLSGHGREPAAMAEASVNDWLQDAVEALEIGKRLGDQVVLIGTSTGGTLATWLAMQEQSDSVAGLVLLSPNFGLPDAGSMMLAGPWGTQFARLVVGAEHHWEPLNEAQAQHWHYRYSSAALPPMMALVKHVRDMPLESMRLPLLVIYSPQDTVVDPQQIERQFQRFGSDNKQQLVVTEHVNADNHVLAGDILAPEHTAVVQQAIAEFLTEAN